MKDNISNQELQDLLYSGDLLVDFDDNTEKVRPWAKKKVENLKMAESHFRIASKDDTFKSMAGKIQDCGSFLDFKYYYENGTKKLNRANFCKYRLCPMCSWRRSLKIFGQASKVLDEAKNQEYEFIFITLTQKNCTHNDLPQEITKIINGLRLLMRRKEIKKVVHGSIRILEITHNIDRLSPSFDTFHPHVHMIWAVKQTYFKSGYISQANLTDLWQQSMKLDYKPTAIDIRRVKTKGKGHIREVAKYSVKPGEILTDDYELTDKAVFTLHNALHNRRLLSWGGVLKDIRKEFNFDDPENGDLVNTDQDQVDNDELNYILVRYRWSFGYKQYLKSDETIYDPKRGKIQL